MKKQFNGLFLMLPLALTIAVYILPLNAATTKHFDIYQNNSAGGGGCQSNANCFNNTSPGPNIIVNQGDSVSITVHNNDTITSHTFTITTSPYTAVDTGQMSPSQVMTLTTFTAGTFGSTFHYQCTNHPTTMRGNFIVNKTSGAPITPTSLLALVFTATAAVYITMRKRR